MEDVRGKYWRSVQDTMQLAISQALQHQAKVCMIEDEYFVGMSECQLFADETSIYDVVIVQTWMCCWQHAQLKQIM